MPSVAKLRTLMLRGESHSIQLKAATEILDRAGIVAPQQVEVDNQVTVTVSYADVELARTIVGSSAERAIDVTYALGDGQKESPANGAENGRENGSEH